MTEEKLKDHDNRLRSLEDFRQEVRVIQATDIERQKSINRSIDSVGERLDKIDHHFGKVFWIIGGVVLVAVAKWMLSGGLGAI